jgi:CRP-like cAMP-binding protein
MGEYYFSQGNIEHATYAYQSYLKYLPTGQYVPQVKKKLMSLNQPIALPPIDETKFNRSYADNKVIFCEHEPGRELYIIQSGKVKISKIVNNNEVMLAVLQTGDIFGEMAILDNKPRSASAVAFGYTDVLAINKANFEGMVKAQPQLASRLITILIRKNMDCLQAVSKFNDKRSTRQNCRYTLNLAEKNSAKIIPKSFYDFDITVRDLLKNGGSIR